MSVQKAATVKVGSGVPGLAASLPPVRAEVMQTGEQIEEQIEEHRVDLHPQVRREVWLTSER